MIALQLTVVVNWLQEFTERVPIRTSRQGRCVQGESVPCLECDSGHSVRFCHIAAHGLAFVVRYSCRMCL